MASPAVVPAILPADFNGWDKAPPKTLPANFNGWDAPKVAGSEALGVPKLAAHPSVTMQTPSLRRDIDTASAPDSVAMRNGRIAGQGPIIGRISNAANAFGSGTAQTLIQPLAHPVKAALGLASAIAHSSQYDPENPISQQIQSTVGDFRDNGAAEAIPRLAGQAVGTLAGGELTRLAAPVLGEGIARTGQGMEDAGAGVINKTAGMLSSDFKRGANGGKAYLDAGGGPALSMQSLADKAAALKSGVGHKIGTAINAPIANIAKIPAADVARRLQGPLGKAFDIENGPGGMGNTAPLEEYSSSFRPAIQGAVESGGFTPRSLFDLKKGIAANTNWSDPAQFNLKAVRQQQAGALSGLLEENVPELRELNPQFQGLSRLATRTADRASTGSSPLTTLVGKVGGGALGAALGAGHGTPALVAGTGLGLALDSIPVKTALGSGLYRGGKVLSTIGGKLKRIP